MGVVSHFDLMKLMVEDLNENVPPVFRDDPQFKRLPQSSLFMAIIDSCALTALRVLGDDDE